MGHRCCSKQKVKKGLWSPEEDEKLLKHINTHGHGSWSSVPKLAGLQRCGKSCRLRWINYLRPDLRRGSFTEEEEQIIIDVHRILGNRWAQIAKHLPGRTDNEVKNYWNSCIKKKLMSKGLDPNTHVLMPSHQRAAASNKIACNIQQPISTPAFAMNSSQVLPMSNFVSMEIIRRPVLTLPAPTDQSSLLQPTAIPMPPASEYQNPNFVWNACDQNSQDHSTNFPNYVSSSIDHLQNGPTSSPSCSSLMNPPGFGLTDENYCMWDTSTNVGQLFEVPSLEAKLQQQRGKENNICDHQAPQTDKVDDEANMDCSFDSSSFDHHLDFVDSTLMAGAVCRDLSSISTDDFAWNFS